MDARLKQVVEALTALHVGSRPCLRWDPREADSPCHPQFQQLLKETGLEPIVAAMRSKADDVRDCPSTGEASIGIQADTIRVSRNHCRSSRLHPPAH
jgi:hypothetical protein